MTNKNNSIDGFSLRRRDNSRVRNLGSEPVPERFLKENTAIKPVQNPQAQSTSRHQAPKTGLKRSDIDESLKNSKKNHSKRKDGLLKRA